MQGCGKRFLDCPGTHASRITALKMEPAASKDEEGLIRAHGHLENARILPKDMRNPVVLPRDHQLMILLLRHLHSKRGHCGYKSLMHEARRKYWKIGLRKMAKAVVSNCVLCRKLRRKPLDQLMGQVPSLRVAAGFPPFSNTAMDMFRPLQIRLNRRTLQEAQVVIFTCTTTRAIHIELVTDKSSEAFLMAFRRFTCLHGHPNICWSDCGSNFVGAQEYLREVMQDWDIPKIQSAISEEFACISSGNGTPLTQAIRTELWSHLSNPLHKHSTVCARTRHSLKSNGGHS